MQNAQNETNENKRYAGGRTDYYFYQKTFVVLFLYFEFQIILDL